MAWTVCDVRPSARSWKICRSDCCENWHMGTFCGVDLHLGYRIFQKLIFSHLFGGQSLTYQVVGLSYYDILAFYWFYWMYVCNALAL